MAGVGLGGLPPFTAVAMDLANGAEVRLDSGDLDREYLSRGRALHDGERRRGQLHHPGQPSGDVLRNDTIAR